jgi:two-component system sensor histidine kinase HydH
MIMAAVNWILPPKMAHGGFKLGLIAFLVVLVSVLHFGTSTDYRYLHEIYQRVYYIPILLAAFWFGPAVGLLTALTVSVIYVFHIRWDWHHAPTYTFNQYAEICLYHVVALIIGVLSAKQRRQQEQLARASRELESAYGKLRETFEQLRRADRLAALGKLSAGIAHEIRNPLASVKGSVEILETVVPAGHPKREFVEIIREETDRLNRIITEFLKFARPPEPRTELVLLNDLVRSTLLLLQKEVDRCGIRLEVELDPALPALWLDPDQIRQVLLNILINAIQAMPEGGRLEVRSGWEAAKGEAAIEVADTGPGVPDAELDQIFDPFYSTRPDGSGLGLSICYQLVERHGGRILAENRPQGGLRLVVRLPLNPAGVTVPAPSPVV